MTHEPEHDSPDKVLPCTPLRGANKVEMDARLSFQTEGHKYFFDDRQVSVSVSQLQLQDGCLVKVCSRKSRKVSAP